MQETGILINQLLIKIPQLLFLGGCTLIILVWGDLVRGAQKLKKTDQSSQTMNVVTGVGSCCGLSWLDVVASHLENILSSKLKLTKSCPSHQDDCRPGLPCASTQPVGIVQGEKSG